MTTSVRARGTKGGRKEGGEEVNGFGSGDEDENDDGDDGDDAW